MIKLFLFKRTANYALLWTRIMLSLENCWYMGGLRINYWGSRSPNSHLLCEQTLRSTKQNTVQRIIPWSHSTVPVTTGSHVTALHVLNWTQIAHSTKMRDKHKKGDLYYFYRSGVSWGPKCNLSIFKEQHSLKEIVMLSKMTRVLLNNRPSPLLYPL